MFGRIFVGAVVVGLIAAEARADPGDEYGHVNDEFGAAVALDGSRLAVGVAGADAVGVDAGQVYLYEHDGDEWTLAAQLVGDETAAYEHFGRALALQGDTLVVGAAIEDGSAAGEDQRRGAVYVFSRGSGVWVQTARLQRDDVDSDSFGRALALLGDTLVVASDERVRAGEPLSGEVVIYGRSGDAWSERGRIAGPDGYWRYGWPLALGPEVLLVGALDEDVQVFRRDGEAWQTDGVLPVPDDAYVGLGRQVALDGATAMLTADDELLVYADRDGGWQLAARVGLEEDERLGRRAGLGLAGEWAALGLENWGIGEVAVFRREADEWGRVATIDIPSPVVEDLYPRFGAALALGEGWLVAGAPGGGLPVGEQSGEVHVFANRDGFPAVIELTPEDQVDGCGCTSAGDRGWLWLWLVAVVRRRREVRA